MKFLGRIWCDIRTQERGALIKAVQQIQAISKKPETPTLPLIYLTHSQPLPFWRLFTCALPPGQTPFCLLLQPGSLPCTPQTWEFPTLARQIPEKGPTQLATHLPRLEIARVWDPNCEGKRGSKLKQCPSFIHSSDIYYLNIGVSIGNVVVNRKNPFPALTGTYSLKHQELKNKQAIS